MSLLYSRTIPCKKCGAKGETIKTVAGWYCEKCLREIATTTDQKRDGKTDE